MIQFIFATDQTSERFCLQIAKAMQLFFGITQEDAIARINEHWKNTALLGDEDFVYQDTADYWARWIFFGRDSWRHTNPFYVDSLSRIERKLNTVLDHLGIDYSGVADRVLALIHQGKKLDAITLYRQETGLDLRQAKDVIERLTEQGSNQESVP